MFVIVYHFNWTNEVEKVVKNNYVLWGGNVFIYNLHTLSEEKEGHEKEVDQRTWSNLVAILSRHVKEGEDAKVMVDKAWEEKERWKDSALWVRSYR